MFAHNAFAMGDAPGTCTNRYDGPITSFIINNGSQTFDAIANPGVTFDVNFGSSYSVKFVIHTPSTSSQGNTLNGTTWYDDDVWFYGNGHCIPDRTTTTVGPNQNVTVSRNLPYNPNTPSYPGYLQSVNFYSWFYPGGHITYNVQFITPSGIPTNLSATATSSSQINLSWTAPANNGGSAITGYMIERSIDNGTTWSTVVANTESTSTTYSDTGLVHSTTYTYRVSAINSIGTSFPSNTASARTFDTVPTPPTGLTATTNLLQINLSWNAPSDNGGTLITGYMIERSTDGGTTWSTLVTNTGSTITTYSDTNVLPLTTYTYRVSAINDVGTSSPSNIASATTSVGPITQSSLP
ncbi:MAG: fibronectin type III domain-containing protein [Nitrosotalea sp.]